MKLGSEEALFTVMIVRSESADLETEFKLTFGFSMHELDDC